MKTTKLIFSQCCLLAAVIIPLITGCHSMRNGGAPDPSFNIDQDLKDLERHFGETNTISRFYSNPSKEERNRFVTGRLVAMNIRYIQFVRTSTSERQLLDSAADILLLSLNLAGAATGTATTKTILASIAAGVTGSKSAYDKNYYFEKTIPALIASMNAQRKEALLPILEGVKKDLNDYPFEQAVTDLHNYYFAGTYLGAIQAIQADAAEKDKSTQKKIVLLSALTEKDVVSKQSLTKAIGALVEDDIPKIKGILNTLTPNQPPPGSLDDGKEKLQDQVRAATTPQQIEKLGKIFRENKILP